MIAERQDQQPPRTLRLTVRTPHTHLLEEERVESLRVLTESGHAGLRPGIEPLALALEAGIVNLRVRDSDSRCRARFLGTAGGLLTSNGRSVTILTPLAVVGDDRQQIVDELQRVLSQPNSEMTTRATLGKLENHILKELRRDQQPGSAQQTQGRAENL